MKSQRFMTLAVDNFWIFGLVVLGSGTMVPDPKTLYNTKHDKQHRDHGPRIKTY